jgi:hypothetical protein
MSGPLIGVIIIGIGSAHNKDQRDDWLIWTNDRCHHRRHRFCTRVKRIKEMDGLYGLTIGVIIIGIGSAHT